MNLKSIYSPLALLALTIWVIGCSAKAPERSIPFIQPPELSEQDVFLTKLDEPEVMQTLFDEMSRVAWLARLSEQTLSHEEVQEGCLLYQVKPERSLIVVGVDCTGPEPRISSASLSRTVQGSATLHKVNDSTTYAGGFFVHRFRPNQPKKIVRMANLDVSMFIGAVKGDAELTEGTSSFTSTIEFAGIRPKKLKRAESWKSVIDGTLVLSKTAPAMIEKMKTLEIEYRAETGEDTKVSMTAIGSVKFASQPGGLCPRPIGTFEVITKTNALAEDGKVKTSVSTTTIITSIDGFKADNSTKVTPWPSSCFEIPSR